MMFPAAAALGWAVLVYIGLDFGFWGKVFALSADSEQIWRASGEAILAATLVVFLFAYLNLNRWHVRYAHITLGWLAFLAALVALALYEPPIASGIARLSFFAVALLGFALVVYLSFHGFDRAVLLIPTWLLLVLWVIMAALAVTAVITNDVVGPALLGGLVLIVMLIGFTVMQHAFAGGVTSSIVSDVERRALALTGAGDMIWDWDVSADKVFTSAETETLLGLKRGSLEGPAACWLDVLHPLDRDRFRAVLDSVLEQRRGRLTQDFRLRNPQDTLARLAGDQFAVILLSERETERVIAFTETLRKGLRAPITFNDRELFLTASIGVALYAGEPGRTEEVLKDAELAMYHAKRIGGDRIEVFKPSMRARQSDRATLESELRRALEREEIAILYQPIVRLEDRSVAGFEAMPRWHHPQVGRASPAEFIAIAEEVGLIVELGMFVLEHAARQLSSWQGTVRPRDPLFVSVNMSSRQLLRQDLIHDLRTVIARA